MEATSQESQDLLTRYHEELSKLVAVDEFNMKQVQMDLPANRHYWVGRLMFHKSEITKLKKSRKQAQHALIQKMQKESPVTLTSKTLDASVVQHPILQKIDDQIAENEILIEYLSKIEANFRSISFDIKNLIEIIRLETT